MPLELQELERLIKETLSFTDAETRYVVRRQGVRVEGDQHYELRGAHIEKRKIIVNGEEKNAKLLVLDIELGFDHEYPLQGDTE